MSGQAKGGIVADDVWMLETFKGASFALEPFEQGWFVSDVAAEYFCGQDCPAFKVKHSVDLGECTLAHQRIEPVAVSENLPNQVTHHVVAFQLPE